jgi:DUF1680 family protein
MMYANTGDEAFKARGALMVAELAKCQQALGGGYLSAFPAEFFDRWEATQKVWAPYYTIHKIMAGMYDQQVLCGNAQALDVAKGMVAWFKKRTDKFSNADMDRMMDRNEEGGMAEVLWDLYALTGEADCRTLAERFEERSFLDRLARGEDCLAGRHGNTHIPLAIGAARRYELTGEGRYRYMATFFWDRVVNTRSFATGGSTNAESWGPAYELAHTLSATNHETCKTYNMLRLTRHLFEWTADPLYADFYERAFLNGIMGTQDPANGMLEYYVPQATGSQRVFGTPTDAFWCCYGTGIETWAKSADSIYFHDAESLYVNLFIASAVDWAEKGVKVEQRTSYPEEPATKLVVHAAKPVKLAVKIRMPGWLADRAEVRINGQAAEADARPGAYVTLSREWKEGDEIEVKMPMRLHVWAMPDDPNMVALMYGPVVLAGLLDAQAADKPLHGDDMVEARPGEGDPAYYFVADSPEDVSWLRPVEGQRLTFRTVGQPLDMAFVPFYRVIGKRYGLNWLVLPKGSDRQVRLERENAERERQLQRRVDFVRPGDESEKAHNLKAESSHTGMHLGRGWRDAPAGGWWSWEMKVAGEGPLKLACTYWGDDVPPRTFDIVVDGRTIATQSLNRSKPGEFFTVEYAIPAELTRGKEKVTVMFRGQAGNTAGGVFGCAILK